MIIDTLDNLEKYVSLNPLFPKAFEYLKSTDLNALEPEKVVLQGADLVVNTSFTKHSNCNFKSSIGVFPGMMLVFTH